MNAYRATENYVYKTDECIGRGATGDVYKGVHKVRISNSTFSFAFFFQRSTVVDFRVSVGTRLFST